MRTITINGVSFQWKLREAAAKALGISGPGNKEGLERVLIAFFNDWDTAKTVVLAGVSEQQKTVVEAALSDWSSDEYTEFISQAFATPNAAASAPVQ